MPSKRTCVPASVFPRFAADNGYAMTLPPGSGTYRRLSGTLRAAAHSAVLDTDGQRVIRLITSDDLTEFDGIAVIVEGHMSAGDRLQLEWIGRSPT